MEPTLQTLVIALYLVTLGALALYGAHRSALLFLYLRHRHERTAPRSRYDEADLPIVTIQLPMFNEMFVAERLIDVLLGELGDSREAIAGVAKALGKRLKHA